MYIQTSYIPKINNNCLGNAIISKCGFTQGRKSSATLFSFEIHGMPESLLNPITPTFLLQLADDAAIAVFNDHNSLRGLDSLSHQLQKYFRIFEKEIFVNFDKTCYINISKNSVSIALPIEGFQDVMPAKDNKTVYLGMHIVQSNTICDQIDVNLKNFTIGWM